MAAREKDVACAQSEVRVEREARGKGEARPESEACTECGTRAKGEARPESEACTECGTRAKGEARAEELIEFIESCPSMFHTAATISGRLDAAGFTYLSEGAAWELARGGRYYTVRNNSSVIAWQVGADVPEAGEGGLATHFQLCASHSDSPTFKLKSVPELEGPGSYLRLDTEAYGGMIDYTWFDRPLGIAGRVLVREGTRVESRLVAPDRDLAIIPSVPIHMQRDVNDGFAPNRARDLCPLVSIGALGKGSLDELLAAELGVEPEQILARDLFLVNRQPGRVWGAAQEFVSVPKLDDLACAFTSLEAFLGSENAADVSVYACFDNEEVGSNTKQGAMSTFLRDTLARVVAGLGGSEEDYHRALACSMLVSCDNAHGTHPNRPDLHDSANAPVLGGGLVVKEAANQKYCTDAFSRAALLAVCADAGVPTQTFANRSDMAGGSTLGNLSNIQASMHAVDVGLPQLAMHSSYETGAVADVELAIRALRAFYNANLAIDGADAVTIR